MKNTEKYRSGELTKKCFLNEMMKIKNVEHISDDQWKRLVNKYKRYNLGDELIESMSGRSPKKGKRFRLGQKRQNQMMKY
nr:hypothetical protein [Mycoplasmopsis bovis]